MSELISKQAAIDATWFEPSYADPLNVLTEVRDKLKALPSAQPESHCIPVTKDEVLRAGYEGREVKFRIDGRQFAIRKLAQ